MVKTVNKMIPLTIFLGSIILSSTIMSMVITGPSFLLQEAEATSKSKSKSQAAAAISKTYNALAAGGITGRAGGLQDTGDGFAQFYRNSNGTVGFAIFWKPSTGAHAVVGPIMLAYKAEGWHLGDLGYPKSDERDLSGVTNGRYNEFEHGVIAALKGKGAQAFPTAQAAVETLKETSPQAQAAAAIKKAYDALAAGGITGTPDKLQSAGDGFAQFYRNSNGTTAFAIFAKDGNAHAVVGPIMLAYKAEGWHFGDLGFPTSGEKDLAGVTNGRYNEFEHGVIAAIKGKGAKAFPTVQAAADGLKEVSTTAPVTEVPTQTQEPAKAPPIEKYQVSVHFTDIGVRNDHDGVDVIQSLGAKDDGEYRLGVYVQDLPLIDLTALSQWKTPGKGGLNDVRGGGSALEFKPGNKYTFQTDSTTALTLLTVGYESDGCASGLTGLFPSSIGDSIKETRKNGSAAAGAAVGAYYGGPAGAEAGKVVGPILDGIAQGIEKKIESTVLCFVNGDDDIGTISVAYDPPSYGSGHQCVESDAKDYELCFDVAVQKIG